jgi:DNA mismatch repair protein MutL
LEQHLGMATIAVLSPELASQIAAGEVVERPASAVKELVENAVDASAARCDIEIEGGGITRISVSDDGAGMSEEDARLAVQRHATSKLRTLHDLKRIRSFGFRGEALPSIASVSRLVLCTRVPNSDAGTEVSIVGGGEATVRPIGAAVGTTVHVRDLFFNVPARRKFLRSSGTESGHVTEVIEAAALTSPHVTFTLKRDGRQTRELLRASNREDRVRQCIGGEPLAACRGERGPLAIEAYLSRPERARTGAGGLRLIVNQRAVRDRTLAVTVAHAYGSVLERGRYPRGVVYLDLPVELVDVNVHPQKSEVRFADPRAVSDALYGVLSRALASAFSLPTPARAAWGSQPSANLAESEPQGAVAERSDRPGGSGVADPWGLTGGPGATEAALPPAEPGVAGPRAATPSPEGPIVAVRDSAASPLLARPGVRWSNLRFVAQVRQTYLVCESDDGLYVLDQHAASERVNFDRLIKAYRAHMVASQSLLFPVVLEVSETEAELAGKYNEQIAELGLDVRVRGPDTVSVHATPKLLLNASPERLVRDLLTEMSRSGGRGFSDAVDQALATMACHGSLRAGDVLSSDEASALLDALDQAQFAGHCPHGRPVVAFTSWAELERKVGRR